MAVKDILIKFVCLFITIGIICVSALKQNDSTNKQLQIYTSSSTNYNHARSERILKDVTRRQLTDAYYDFLINEGSFKFWAVFQMVTIAILFYSTFAAIYYAKYTYLHEQPSEEDGDIFLRSGRARSKRDINEVLRAIHTPPT